LSEERERGHGTNVRVLYSSRLWRDDGVSSVSRVQVWWCQLWRHRGPVRYWPILHKLGKWGLSKRVRVFGHRTMLS
jgi:hypothetical protein